MVSLTCIKRAPAFAYVVYKDGGTAVVHVSLIKDFDPESVHDLTKNKKIYWHSDDASADVRDEGFYGRSMEELGGELKCMTAHHS